MKILFAMSSPEYLRFYDATIRQLAERGHEVSIAVNAIREGKPVRFDAIGGDPSRVAVLGVIPERSDRWLELARAVRGTMDFVRYLHPALAEADVLRARMKRQALPSALQWMDRCPPLPPRRLRRAMAVLAAMERAIPPAPALARFLDEHDPDVVIVSPLVEAASDQVDLVKAAQARGARVAVAVASWDNLTNKGDLRVEADRVLVWNEAQKREAIEFHRVPAANVVVTGAQLFDRWFDRTPSRSREEFCRVVGLPAGKPFVLYVGSSIFISRAEAEMPFVRRWIETLRASADPAVRDLAVLVRPHPYNGSAWRPETLDGLPEVVVWPRGGYNPIEEQNRADFFDTLYHSAAVVGINTSAMIEAAIIGRPVLSIVTSDFARTQEGTLHFRHLLPENGGFLRIAPGLDEHARQLADVLGRPGSVREEIARFVASFVRPHGVDRPCTPILVDAIEDYGRSAAPAPARTAVRTAVIRALAWPLTLVPDALLVAPSRRKTLKRKAPATVAGVAEAAGAPVRPMLALTVAGPAVAATLLALAFGVLELSGRTPFSYPASRNIAEAAGMGRGAEVLRLLRQGGDPGAVLDVRPDIISSSVTRVTALEAAIWSRRVELVRMLDRHGAIGADGVRRHLACLAAELRAEEIQEYLAGGDAGGCDAGGIVRLIEARAE